MRKYYDTTQVGERLKRDPHTIRDWIRYGCPTSEGKVKLPAAKFGKTWMVKDEDLELFEHRVRSRSERPALDLEENENADQHPVVTKGKK